MMRRANARQGLLDAFSQETLNGEPFGAHFHQAELMGAGSRDDDEIDAMGQEPWPGPETLPAEALDPVALHGAPDASRRHDAKAGCDGIPRLSGHEQGEVRRAHAPAQAL